MARATANITIRLIDVEGVTDLMETLIEAALIGIDEHTFTRPTPHAERWAEAVERARILISKARGLT
jgi:class 3 adenylate cyclase